MSTRECTKNSRGNQTSYVPVFDIDPKFKAFFAAKNYSTAI